MRAAAASPFLKPESASKLFEQAETIEERGPGKADKRSMEQAAFEEWSEMTGMDYRDPETMDKVYAAVAAMRKNEVEAAARAAQAKAEAVAKARRKATRSGTMP